MKTHGSIIDLLTASPWPLTVTDIASALDCDELTAVDALRLMRQHGRATLAPGGTGWLIV